MSQPTWKLIANLGDENPIDYGGYFVYADETGVYDPAAELLIAPDDNDGQWLVYRFSLERCTFIGGILSENKFHPQHPAWFAKPESEKANRPQDTTYLSNVADFGGVDLGDLQESFCSADPIERAMAYRLVGEYHGFDNLDSYPLTLTRQEAEERYSAELAK